MIKWPAVNTETRKIQGKKVILGLSGGVANNKRLRKSFEGLANSFGVGLSCAESRHTGDNASMVAFASLVDPKGTFPGSDCALTFLP